MLGRRQFTTTYNAVILLTLQSKKIQTVQTISDLLPMPDEELKENIVKGITRSLGERIVLY